MMDQGSLNGSLRNSVRMKPFVKYEVRCDDRLQFGCVGCVFKIRNTNKSEFSEELTRLPDENFENMNVRLLPSYIQFSQSEGCCTCKDNASTTDGIVSPRVVSGVVSLKSTVAEFPTVSFDYALLGFCFHNSTLF